MYTYNTAKTIGSVKIGMKWMNGWMGLHANCKNREFYLDITSMHV